MTGPITVTLLFYAFLCVTALLGDQLAPPEDRPSRAYRVADVVSVLVAGWFLYLGSPTFLLLGVVNILLGVLSVRTRHAASTLATASLIVGTCLLVFLFLRVLVS